MPAVNSPKVKSPWHPDRAKAEAPAGRGAFAPRARRRPPLSRRKLPSTERGEFRRSPHAPVVTGSMRNRVRAQGIEAARGACDGGSEAQRESLEYPHPGCFGKRGCKRLKTKETRAEKSTKRRQRGGKPMQTKEVAGLEAWKVEI